MELINNLGEADKINVVSKMYRDRMILNYQGQNQRLQVDQLMLRYWNDEVQRKVRLRLEFGKYSPIKESMDRM